MARKETMERLFTEHRRVAFQCNKFRWDKLFDARVSAGGSTMFKRDRIVGGGFRLQEAVGQIQQCVPVFGVDAAKAFGCGPVAWDKGFNNEDEEWERFGLVGSGFGWEFVSGFEESCVHFEIFIKFGHGYYFFSDKWDKFKGQEAGSALKCDRFRRGFLEVVKDVYLEPPVLGKKQGLGRDVEIGWSE